jgi:hypothetical protein
MTMIRVLASMALPILMCCGPAKCADFVTAGALLQHCVAKSGQPDEFCIGYFEATQDFVLSYQLWLTMKGYDFPPDEIAVCPAPATTSQLAKALRDYLASLRIPEAQAMSMNAMKVIPAALSKHYPCPIPRKN